MRNSKAIFAAFSLMVAAGCSGEITPGDGTGAGGSVGPAAGGSVGPAAGGSTTPGNGGSGPGAGGFVATGGALGSGGFVAAGGQAPAGGSVGAGGFQFPTGGSFPAGGAPGGGSPGVGGSVGTGGGTPSGGSVGTGGAPTVLDCNATLPTSGATDHNSNGQGGSGNLAWEIWSNEGTGHLTTYANVPAFKASWNEDGGYLGRMGFEWGGFQSNPVPFEQMGTISADVSFKKSGTAGGYSYVGIYGWSSDPCVEWYIIDDSFGNFPLNPGNPQSISKKADNVSIGGDSYDIYSGPTTGTGGTRCSGITEWQQFYSVRQTARQCGTIPITAHFQAWKDQGLVLGDILEAKVLAEVGGGTGSVEFPVANVTLTP